VCFDQLVSSMGESVFIALMASQSSCPKSGGVEGPSSSSSSSFSGRGSSSPESVMRTARRGSGRGAKRILRTLEGGDD
jgi:hypothetical protein